MEFIKRFNTGNIFLDVYYLGNGNGTNGRREFNIKSLCDFISSSPKDIPISPEVQTDIELYKEYLLKRKKIWMGKGAKGLKQEKINRLEAGAGRYD